MFSLLFPQAAPSPFARPDDQFWIITDGAVKTPKIGATLYVTRNNKLQLAGFFSAKLRGRQVRGSLVR